ncbi:transposable element Tc1 transposase [Trichonephila clavipes]|nr:transposable element Tc1 transposase [Trichonephila clavipes]
MVWGNISYDSRRTSWLSQTHFARQSGNEIQTIVFPFMNSIQGGVFQQDNGRPHTTVVTQRAVQSVNKLPSPTRSPVLSPIEHM